MQTLTPMTVPKFSIGESAGPMEYLRTELPAFCERMYMPATEQERFVAAGLASAEACIPLMSQEAMLMGKVEPVPQAREFWNLVGDTLLSEDSTTMGLDHLKTAIEYQAKGWNVALVQNHRAGSDMLVMETLIRRHFGQDICAEWGYMAGHAVNLFLIPLMFSAGLRRFQIFSVKYQSNGIPGMDLDIMKQQNQRALMALRRYTSKGGTTTVYYPEGGRGDGAMKDGEPRTSCIPKAIAEGGKGLIILPTYVAGTEQLLRPARGQNEFNEVLAHMDRGTASLTIGEPICWEAVLEANKAHEDDKTLWNRRVCDTLLTLVARLGPVEQAGKYNPHTAGMWSLIAPLLNGACS